MFALDYQTCLREYEAGHFVSAFASTSSHWAKPQSLATLSPRESILAGRFAHRLGGSKYGRWLFRRAVQLAPDDAEVRYYARNYLTRCRSTYDYLWALEKNPPRFPDRADLQAYSDADRGHLWAQFRDFARSRDLFAKALSQAPHDYWVNSLHALSLCQEDRLEEALAAAQRAWQKAKFHPTVAATLAIVLTRQERLPEALNLLLEATRESQSAEIALETGFRLAGYTRRLPRNERGSQLEQLREIEALLPARAPLADRAFSVALARLRVETAMLAEDFDRARRHVQTANHPFFEQVLKHEQSHSGETRRLLPHRPVRQAHRTCLPSSIETVLSAFGNQPDIPALVASSTYAGTSVWQAEDWLRARGYCVRHFLFSPELAERLIAQSLPFLLHESYEFNAHTIAVVGLDAQLGVMLSHDPSSSGLRETILARANQAEAPLGPTCSLVLPPGVPSPALPNAAVLPAECLNDYFRQLATDGIHSAELVLRRLEAEQPGHPMGSFLRARFLTDTGRAGEALKLLKPLLVAHPSCQAIRQQLLAVCGLARDNALRRETLGAIVQRRNLPGIDSSAPHIRVSPAILCDYADALNVSQATRREALTILRDVVRHAAHEARAYHILSDVLLTRDQREERAFAAGLAARLEETDDHYAQAYFDALRRTGREGEGFAYLTERARTLGQHPKGAGALALYVNSLDEAGRGEEAAQEMATALEQFPDDPERLRQACAFWNHRGEAKQAEAALARLKQTAPAASYLAAAAEHAHQRGDWTNARRQAEARLAFEPGDLDAREAVLRQVQQADGPVAALALARRWLEENPRHERYEELVLRLLGHLARQSERIELLRPRVARNPRDDWALRELGFELYSASLNQTGEERQRLLAEAKAIRQACEPLGPTWAIAVMDAYQAEAADNCAGAIDALFAALDDQPDYPYAYRRIAELACALDCEAQRACLERLAESCVRIERDPDFEFLHIFAARLGAGEVLRRFAQLEAAFPGHPNLREARADLLLRYGRGADRQSLPEAEPELILADLREAVRRFPGHRGLRLSLASALERRDQTAEAGELLREFLNRFPLDFYARRMLAGLLERTGDQAGARALLEAGLALHPARAESYDEFATFLDRSGDSGAAEKILRRGLAKLPENIQLIESTVNLLIDTGQPAEAETVARAGLKLYPQGAFLQHLLGLALAESAGHETEAEAAFRTALMLNPNLFAAADRLAYRLSLQNRFDEGIEIVTPFLSRGEYIANARGRIAWLRHLKGETERAYTELREALALSPGYSWGWGVLIDWLERDQNEARIRESLLTMPEAMCHAPKFRGDRLRLLETLSPKPETLDAEWEGLLADFPHDLPLHLKRFDALSEAGRTADARAVLDRLAPQAADNPYILSRRVALAAQAGDGEAALQDAETLWILPPDGNDWPELNAYDTLAKSGLAQPAAAAVVRLITAEKPVRIGAIRRLVEALCPKAAKTFSGLRIAVSKGLGMRHWLCHSHRRVMKVLLEQLSRSPFYPKGLATALEALRNHQRHEDVLRFLRHHPALFQEEASLVGAAVSTLCSLELIAWPKVRSLLKDWRRLRGISMWLVCNYLLALEKELPGTRGEIVGNILELLREYQHDQTAWFNTALLLEHDLKGGNFTVFMDHYREFAQYAAREPQDEEFWQSERPWHKHAFPFIYRILTAPDQEQAHSAIAELAQARPEICTRELAGLIKPALKSRNFACPKLRKPWKWFTKHDWYLLGAIAILLTMLSKGLIVIWQYFKP